MFHGGVEAPGVCRASFIGGIHNAQELIELCDQHHIFPETTVHPVAKQTDIYEWLNGSNEAGICYVLDVAAVKAGAQRMPTLRPADGRMEKITVVREVLWMKFCAPTFRGGAASHSTFQHART